MNTGFSKLSRAALLSSFAAMVAIDSAQAATLSGNMNVDNSHTTYISTDDATAGTQIASGNNWRTTDTFGSVVLEPGRPYFLHVNAANAGGPAAFLGDYTLSGGGHSFAGGGTTALTDTSWVVSTSGWSGYAAVTGYGTNGVSPWGFRSGVDANAVWIWTSSSSDNDVYFSRTIVPTPTDLAVAKTLDTAGPYYVGDTVQFTVTVSNAGPATAADVDVTNVASNLTVTNVASANCSAFPCAIASMANGESEVITVTATVDALGDFNIVPSVTSITGDPDTANNIDNTLGGTAVDAPADLAVTKTLDSAAPYNVGDTVQFTVTVNNAGPGAAADVDITNVASNLTVSNVASANCSAFPCAIASMANGATEVITVTAIIDALGDFNIVPSVASITSDPDTSNNTDNSPGGTAVDVAGPVAPAQAIPSMPQWLLIMLALILVAVGGRRLQVS